MNKRQWGVSSDRTTAPGLEERFQNQGQCPGNGVRAAAPGIVTGAAANLTLQACMRPVLPERRILP